jgi:hypothetical protein
VTSDGQKREGWGNKETPKTKKMKKNPCKHFGGFFARLKGLCGSHFLPTSNKGIEA